MKKCKNCSHWKKYEHIRKQILFTVGELGYCYAIETETNSIWSCNKFYENETKSNNQI